MTRVTILGAGAMGSAFSFPLADSGMQVRLVGTHLDREWIEAIRDTGVHPKLGVALPDPVVAYSHEQLAAALYPLPDLLVLGVSSPGVPWAVGALVGTLSAPVPILMLTKGLSATGGDFCILPDLVKSGLSRAGLDGAAIGGVGGPCIAAELAARRETSVVLGAADGTLLQELEDSFSAPYYHVHLTRDLAGLEAAAALKNFYALAVGAPAGTIAEATGGTALPLRHNPTASLFAQSLSEMRYLAEYLGGKSETVDGLAGAGDLYVTCQAGRNSRMGRLLGAGIRYRDAKAKHMAEDTVEGADLALAVGPSIESLIDSGALDGNRLPLARSIIRAVCGNAKLTFDWRGFHQC